MYINKFINHKFIIDIILLLFIFIIIIHNNDILNINFYISYFKLQIEFKKNDNYIKLNTKKIKIKNFKKKNNPKISVVSPIYNRERFIFNFLLSIQNQNFIELEIILVDDFSTDKSLNIIEYFKQFDKRIILISLYLYIFLKIIKIAQKSTKLIKNKKNRGTLMSRNIGILFSKGKYILLPDPDDILYKNILNICYKFAEKYNYEIIRFNLYLGKKKIHFEKLVQIIGYKIVFQKELSTYSFYATQELKVVDLNVSNKLIKKEAYIRVINYLNNIYLNLYMIYMEDALINVILHRVAKSLKNLNIIGYDYIKHSESITNNLEKINQLKIQYAFIFLKVLLEYTKKNKYEKDIANLILTSLNRRFNFIYLLSISTINLKYYYNIITRYINCKFISRENKIILNQYKDIIEKKIH